MANSFGGVTLGSTGIVNINIGMVPTEVELRVCAKNGASAVQSLVLGKVDSAGNESSQILFDDFAGNHYSLDTGQAIFLQRHNGVTWVTELSAVFNGYTANGFSLNVLVANSNYQVQLLNRQT